MKNLHIARLKVYFRTFQAPPRHATVQRREIHEDVTDRRGGVSGGGKFSPPGTYVLE